MSGKDINTILAACGSVAKLNSVFFVIFPFPCNVPPIMNTSLTLVGNVGSSFTAKAMFVKGPIHSKETSFGFSLTILIIAYAADISVTMHSSYPVHSQ